MKKTHLSVRIFLLFILILLFAPKYYTQIADESRLVFDETQIARVDVTISPAALAWIYSNTSSDSEHVASVRFRNAVIDETFDSVGFRLRGATSRTAQKKSFKIDFNTFISGQRLKGLKDINLNGEHNDLSIIRSKLSLDLLSAVGLKTARISYCEVYINSRYYGLYMNVEEPDELFLQRRYKNATGNYWKCIYPADLRYLGENASSYTSILNNGTPAYDLKTNTANPDFGGIIRLARMMGNTSNANMRDSIDLFVDAPSVLKLTAMCVVTGNWDCYWSLMNNYFLYLDPATGRMNMHPYDFDNSFGVSWSSSDWATADIYNWPKFASGARPLVEKLLSNAYYRNMYTHFISFFANNVFTLSVLENKIDSIRNKIGPSALADTFRTKDYGFTYTQFLNSYTVTPFVVQHVKNGLKQFIVLRSSSINSQVNYQDAPPLVYAVSNIPDKPKSTDTVSVVISAFSPLALAGVTLKVTPLGGTAFTLPFVMSRDYTAKDPESYYRYIAKIPPQNKQFSYSVEVKDVQNRISNYPNTGSITVKPQGKYSPLFINELCAENLTYPDPSGEFDDWVELYNSADTVISLKGLFLSDDPTNPKKWKFTQDTARIAPRGRILLWCDEQRTQQGYHTNFKLSVQGEYVGLYDSVSNTVIDDITYGPQISGSSFGRFPDGSRNIEILRPTPGKANALPTGILEQEPVGSRIGLFPNPAANTVTLTNIPAGGKKTICVYNITGKEVLRTTSEASGGSYTISTSVLPAGVYVLVVPGEKVTALKLIISR